MLKIQKAFLTLVFVVAASVATNASAATTKEELSKEASTALQKLIASNPQAAEISKKAKAALIFPNIVKAGLIFGGAYGEGVLIETGQPDIYYNSISASWGLQAGAQSYGYVVFLMNDKAVDYIHKSYGWELGTDPSVTFVNVGAAKNFSTTTLKDDSYGFQFDQQGLMGSLSLEGTKITRIKNN